MIVEHEVEINWKDGKKKVKVSFDLPIPPSISKDELIKEYGDEVLTDYSVEQLMQTVFGDVAKQLSYYFAAIMSSGYEGSSGILLLQRAIGDAANEFLGVIKARRKMEEMS